jgi:hypothetical protein
MSQRLFQQKRANIFVIIFRVLFPFFAFLFQYTTNFVNCGKLHHPFRLYIVTAYAFDVEEKRCGEDREG